MSLKARYGACGVALSVLAFLSGQPAAAQQRGGNATASNPTLFGEVVVTARKRAETAQDVPVAINAYSKAFIETFKIQNIQDLSSFTPGMLTVEANTMGGNHIYLRGVGSQLDNATSEGSVGVVVDGVSVPGEIMRAAQIDMGQIEVLRGPQALFFGKNSPGGVVDYESSTPTHELHGGVTVGYEAEAQQKYVEGYVSGPLTNTLTGRLAIHHSDEVGPWTLLSLAVPGVSLPEIQSHGPHERENAVRGTLAWTPNDTFDVTARLTYFNMFQNTQVITQRLNCTPGANPQPFIIPAYASIEDCKVNGTVVLGPNFPGVLASDPAGTDNMPLGFLENKQYFLPITANYRITPSLTLTSVTGFYDGDERTASNFSNEPVPIIYSDQIAKDLQLSEELRLASKFQGPVNFLAGALAEASQINYRQGIITEEITDGNVVTGYGPGGTPLIEYTRQEDRAYSPFLQLIIKPIRQIEVDLGERYSYEQKSAAFMTSVVPGAYPGETHIWRNWSPEFTVSYRPSERLDLYASYNTGFKSGGVEASAGQPTAFVLGALGVTAPDKDLFNQEVIRGYEAGAKVTTWRDQFHFNIDGFYYNYHDLQLSNFSPSTASITIENIPLARLYGLEFDFNYRPEQLRGLTLYGSVDWLHARYVNYVGDCYAGQSVAQGCNLYYNAAGQPVVTNGTNAGLAGPNPAGLAQSLAGLPMKSAPDWSATFGGDYETVIFDDLRLGLSTDLDYTGKYSADLADDPVEFQKAFIKLNASVRFSSMDRRWQLAIIGDNLTDVFTLGEASKDFVSDGPLIGTGPTASGTGTIKGAGADYFGNVLWGRTVRVELSYKY